MTQEKLNKILVVHGDRKKLMQKLNTTYPTVRGALSGNSDSEISKKIRHLALTEFNGVEMASVDNTNK